MRRVLWGSLSLVLLVAVVALFSLIWVGLFVVAAVAIFIGRWQRLDQPWRAVAAIAILAVVGAALWWSGSTLNHYNPGSAAATNLVGVRQIAGPQEPAEYAATAKAPRPDEAADLREEFRKAVFTLRSQANAAERALDLSDNVQDLVDQSGRLDLSIGSVLDAKNGVGQVLDELGLQSAAALDAKVGELETFLAESEKTAAGLGTAAELNTFWTDFRLRARGVSFSKLQDAVARLEDELIALEKQVVEPRLRMTVQSLGVLDEAGNKFSRQLAVALTWTEVPVTWLDASELLLDRQPGALEEKIFVLYPPGTDAVEVSNPRRFKVTSGPGVNSVTVVKETVVRADLKALPARFRLPQFSYFLFSWPPALPNQKLRVTMDLTKTKGPAEFPYALAVDADSEISSVRVPVSSFYASGYNFKAPRRDGDVDVLDGQGTLRPSYFQTNGRVWMELMPGGGWGWIFRNGPMQAAKGYLLAENLFTGLGVMAIGALWAWFAKGSPSVKPGR